MGNATAVNFSTIGESWTNKEITPDRKNPPKMDPLMGFENREERVAPLTEEQMRLAGVPPQLRGYCADRYISLQKCFTEHMPFSVFHCKHEKHEYEECLIDDQISRMKEYERERRLLKRQLRLNERQGDTL